MNERYIRFAFNHTHRLPYYLADAEAQNEKNLFVLNCLKTISPYKAVWTDGRFTLWKPETDNGERKQKEKDKSYPGDLYCIIFTPGRRIVGLYT